MEIVVTVHHAVELVPERGIAHLSVRTSASDRAQAVAEATGLANRLAAALREANTLKVTVEPLQVYGDHYGRKARHHASVSLVAVFQRPDDIARFQADWAGIEAVEFGWVQWELDPATMQARESEVIAGAFAKAQRRARMIADAAGMGELTVLQVVDSQVTPGAMPMLAAAAPAESASVDINPDLVEVAVTLEVRFRAA